MGPQVLQLHEHVLLDRHVQAALVVEPGGAVGVAALLGGHVRPTGNVIALLSGGNVDLERLIAYMADVGR